MSNLNEILQKSSSSEFIQLIAIFNKDEHRKDGDFPQWIDCRKDFFVKNLDKVENNNEQKRERKKHIS